MIKKLIVEFNFGKKFVIDAEKVANIIADNDAGDSHSDRVAELLNDEFKLFEVVWDLPWVELCPHTMNDCEEPPTVVCVCKEWKRGNAKISVNW